MNKYILEPEVAGGIGGNSILDHQTKPPIIVKLNYEFDDWLGDDLIEGFRCFICAEKLAKAIDESNLTGYAFDECETTKSQLFYDLNENGLNLPKFIWLNVIGGESDDFFMMPPFKLLLTERALNVVKQFNLNNCTIEEYKI